MIAKHACPSAQGTAKNTQASAVPCASGAQGAHLAVVLVHAKGGAAANAVVLRGIVQALQLRAVLQHADGARIASRLLPHLGPHGARY